MNFDNETPESSAVFALLMAQLQAYKSGSLKAISLKHHFNTKTDALQDIRIYDELVQRLEMGKTETSDNDVSKTNLKSYLNLDYVDLSNCDFSAVGEGFNKKNILK